MVIVNRAPVMVAWCAVVCLRMDFDLEESLSMGAQGLFFSLFSPFPRLIVS